MQNAGSDSYRVGAVQMASGADVAANLASAEKLIADAARDGARLVLLPENFGFMGRTWGHSMFVDPWGTVVASHAEGEGVAIGDVDRARIEDVRASLPALAHRTLS
jgi:predicted amidohydrolase